MIRHGIAAIAVGVALAGIITACGGGGSSAPPNAQSVLKADGYTFSQTLTTAAQAASMPAGATSTAIGTNGGNIQAVIVFSSSALASAGASGSAGAGLTTAQNGDVVTVTGSSAAFAAQGS